MYYALLPTLFFFSKISLIQINGQSKKKKWDVLLCRRKCHDLREQSSKCRRMKAVRQLFYDRGHPRDVKLESLFLCNAVFYLKYDKVVYGEKNATITIP